MTDKRKCVGNGRHLRAGAFEGRHLDWIRVFDEIPSVPALLPHASHTCRIARSPTTVIVGSATFATVTNTIATRQRTTCSLRPSCRCSKSPLRKASSVWNIGIGPKLSALHLNSPALQIVCCTRDVSYLTPGHCLLFVRFLSC